MAVTFTVEDGSIVSGANSYVTVAFADDYYTIDTNFSATWAAYTTQEKQNLLMWSTRVIDQKAEWNGGKVEADQPLRWPRGYVYDADGTLIDEDTIPAQLKQAVCEVAKYLVTNDPTTAQDVTNYASLKIDVIDIKYQDRTWQVTFPTIINQLLAGLGRVRVGGSGFGKIIKG